MNIFYLHHLPIIAAKLHCDTHVVKMVLETAQILSTIHHQNGSPAPYKPTHANHPSVKWAAASPAHYRWLQSLGANLCNEYRLRYGRTHACEVYIKGALASPPAGMTKLWTWTEPPKCMPVEYQEGSTVDAYRRYYREAKKSIAKWARLNNTPQFMLEA